MLFEQIIEFESMWPVVAHVFLQLVYFHDKAKISETNLRVDCYLLQKYCWRQCTQ